MRYLAIPLMLIVAVLQASLVPEIRIGEAGPDLALLIVISWTLLGGFEEGVYWAVAGGVLLDLLDGTPTGLTAAALVLVSFGASALFGKVGRNNVIFPPLAILAATVVYHGILIILLRITGSAVPLLYSFTQVTIPSALYNVILILPLFRILGRIYEVSRPRRVGE
jgi:rod shape-determining protein MreD